jgi:hypothetical protein
MCFQERNDLIHVGNTSETRLMMDDCVLIFPMSFGFFVRLTRFLNTKINISKETHLALSEPMNIFKGILRLDHIISPVTLLMDGNDSFVSDRVTNVKIVQRNKIMDHNIHWDQRT